MSMPVSRKVNYFLFCEHVTKDKFGRVSLNNIFDIIGGETLPVRPTKFVVAFSVAITKEDVENNSVTFRIEVKDPSGKEVVKIEGVGKGADKIEEGYAAVELDLSAAIPFEKKGTYAVVLCVNDVQVAEKELQVVIGKQEDYAR